MHSASTEEATTRSPSVAQLGVAQLFICAVFHPAVAATSFQNVTVLAI